MDSSDTAPATTAAPALAADVPAPREPGAAPEDAEEKPSRRKALLLLLLLLAFLLLLLLTIWYLLFRKPISEIIPPGQVTPMPTYQASMYNLSKPQGVAVSPDGSRIYITQTGASLDTVMFDGQGHKLGTLKPPANLIPQGHQLSVAVDPVTNDVWATDRFAGAVVEYAANGTYIKIFDQGQERATWQPLGIGFDKSGDVYVSDVANTSPVIDVFGPDGAFIRAFGQDAGLNNPNGIVVAPDGTVYVTDTGNGRMLVFDANGQQIGEVARGVSAGNLGLPVGIAFDDHGLLEVVDSAASRVQVYSTITAGSRGPEYINGFGLEGNAEAQFMYPNGLAADGRGRVYVADWGNDRLEVWSY